MTAMQRHFVTFFSPGTFVHEETTRPVDSWDVEAAKKMARQIKERYGARPFGFRFSTRSRGPDDLDSKVSAQSPMYFLGGLVRTLKEVEAENLKDEEILRDNMRSNGWHRIITNDNSWRITVPLNDDDIVLDVSP